MEMASAAQPLDRRLLKCRRELYLTFAIMGGFVPQRLSKVFFLILIATCGLLLPQSASADPVGFTGQIDWVNSKPMGYYSAITASLDGAAESGWAGEINFQWLGGTPDGFATQFYAYCVDFVNVLRDPENVTVTSSTGFSNGVAYGGQKSAWLFDNFADAIHGGNPSTENLNVNAAALQIAIWEDMYDSAKDLTSSAASNRFKFTTSGLIQTKAGEYLDALYTNTGQWATSAPTYAAYILDVPVDQRYGAQLGQDQITRGVPVPESSSIVLAGLGIFFLILLPLTRQRALRVVSSI